MILKINVYPHNNVTDILVMENTCRNTICPILETEYNKRIENCRKLNAKRLDCTLDDILQVLAYWDNTQFSLDADFIAYCRDLYERIF